VDLLYDPDSAKDFFLCQKVYSSLCWRSERGEETMKEKRFRNRTEAGQLLATRLTVYAHRPDVLVLALPRGGVAVAFEVASILHVSLDVLIVRKLGVPGREELAMGAIASGGVLVLNHEVVQMYALSTEVIHNVVVQEQHELERREQRYRGRRPVSEVRGRTIILVDDGIATGATMRAAIAAVRKRHPARIVLAVPVAAFTTCEELEMQVDELISIIIPEELYSVGFWYEYFPQATDKEVRDLLEHVMHA
jgi:putative phosphoribosyl transferase